MGWIVVYYSMESCRNPSQLQAGTPKHRTFAGHINGTLHCLGMGTGFFRFGHCARPRIPNRRDTLLYEDEFELTFQVPEADVSAAVSAANVAVGAIPTDRAPAINNAKSCFFLIVCPPIDEF